MKQQYVGDINDYRKYALLRLLAEGGTLKLGICWMLTPEDGRSDGKKTEYLNAPHQWRSYDPLLFGLLRTAVDAPAGNRLTFIETSGIIPDAVYFNELVPDDIIGRSGYIGRALRTLCEADVLFLDPDNGLDVRTKPKGAIRSSKYVYRDEVSLIYGFGCSLVIYQHFPHQKRAEFIEQLSLELRVLCPDASVSTVTTSHVAFFVVAQPAHAEVVASRLSAAEQRLPPKAQLILPQGDGSARPAQSCGS